MSTSITPPLTTPTTAPIPHTLNFESIAYHVKGGHVGVYGPDSDVRANLTDKKEIVARFNDVYSRLLEPKIRTDFTPLSVGEAKERVLNAARPEKRAGMANFFKAKSAEYREIAVEGAVMVARLRNGNKFCDQLWPAGALQNNRRLSVYFPTNSDRDAFVAVAAAQGRDAGELAAELLMQHLRDHRKG